MIINTVTEKEMETILDKSLKLKTCPKCQYPASIVVKLPAYGLHGVKIVCNCCGHETELFPAHETISTSKSFATPTTSIGLAKGIFNAINAWNEQKRL